ncbi:MAG: 23S rRNA (uracil(1939)-C(5))-methyltransferase RlmD [candidate division WOR-3 bacterium]|nr:23S rRNA (uracil(1939)-C(5))-methyltransferase RlmD [candidate division WOR-3 bacterium]
MAKIFELKIEKMNLGAQGIAYLNGKVCFVDFVIPGEEIKAEIIKEKSDYNLMRYLEISRPSPVRIEPCCPVFKICGGCQMQHIDYPAQLELKKNILIDTLRRIGKIELNEIEVFYHNPWNYRNRAQLPVQRNKDLKVGYFKKGTHEVVPHEYCYINQKEINEIVFVLKERIKDSGIEIYDEIRHQGNLRHIIIRRGTNTGQIFITFVTKERFIPGKIYKGLMNKFHDIVGISQNINDKKTNRILGDENKLLEGREFYEERLFDKTFQIGPTSFFQVNIPVFEMAIERIRKEIEGSRIIDLYAGVGAIGICVAHLCNHVTAIEENTTSVLEGIKNAQLNNISNIEFIAGKAEDKIDSLERCDTLILDPPRKGTGEGVIKHLPRMNIKKIIYLSCNPATLARDAQLILKNGYRIKKLYLFDMFPQTYHIESLMVFIR